MDTEPDEREDDQSISPEQFIQFVTSSHNLAAELSDGELTKISQDAISDYEMDKESMADWFERMKRGLELAQLVKEQKSYPFEGSSNVKYPLITSAALQFNARAYPAIVPSDNVVKARVFGSDPQGAKAAQGERVSDHMSYTLTSKVVEWEEDTDRLLVQLPIVGEMFRKWWKDPVESRAKCRLIEPGKLIVNDKVKTLSDAPRLTEELPLYPSEIESRVRSGQFIALEYEDEPEDAQAAQDFIEQHTLLDLDDDGLFEPYIVTVHLGTQRVVRIVADFDESDISYEREEQQVPVDLSGLDPDTGVPTTVQHMVSQEVVTGILAIRRGSHFVSYKFMPGLDGGFHGTGLGLLLGDISDSINTIFNMLLDAGHYASLGGGFIGSDFRLKGGAQNHRPGEWKMVGASGQEISKSIVPLTFPGPDATLFQMLGMLIDAGREIASVKDVITGDSGDKVQTATATIALIEQGMAVFTAAYKRIFRSLKQEFRLLSRINAETVTPEEYNAFHDAEQQFDPAQDYNMASMDIEPVADPRSVTKMQEAAKAQFLMQLAEAGLVDRGEASRRIIEAMDIGNTEKLTPQPDQMQQQMAQVQAAMAQAQLVQARADIELTLARVKSEQTKAMKDMAGIEDDEATQRLDRLRLILDEEGKELDRIIELGTGRMAGKSRDRGDGGGNGPASRGPETAMLEQLLGGQGMAGGGQAIPAPAGTMGGGLL